MSVDGNISEWQRLAKMDLATAHHMFETYHPKPIEIVNEKMDKKEIAKMSCV